eukprot:1159281-Pelagomonas_calceolata.AAC.2
MQMCAQHAQPDVVNERRMVGPYEMLCIVAQVHNFTHSNHSSLPEENRISLQRVSIMLASSTT